MATLRLAADRARRHRHRHAGGGAGQGEADAKAATDGEDQRRCRDHHDQQPGGIDQDACDHHIARTKTVGEQSDKRLRDAPHHILQRRRQREVGGSDRGVVKDRRLKQPKTLPHAHCEAQQNGCTRENRPALEGGELRRRHGRFLKAAEIFSTLASESMTYHPPDAY
jgi:hypothetical protein